MAWGRGRALGRAHGKAEAGPLKAAPRWAGAGDLGQHSGKEKGKKTEKKSQP